MHPLWEFIHSRFARLAPRPAAAAPKPAAPAPQPAVESRSGEERKSLRPVVLGVCFVWGLLCGFMFHIYRIPAKTQEPPPPPQPKAEIPLPAGPNLPTLKPIAAPLDPTVQVDEGIKKTTAPVDGRKPRRFLQTIPVPPLPSLNPHWGLTGATATPPAAPPPDDGAPAIPALRSGDVDDLLEPPELNEAAGPELDNP